MQGARVVGDHDVGPGEEGSQLRQGRAAGQVTGQAAQASGRGPGQGGFVAAADKDYRAAGAIERALGQDGEVLGGPTLGDPARADAQDQPRPRTFAQEGSGPGLFRLGQRHAKNLASVADAERLRHEPVAIHGVDGMEVRHPDHIGIEPGGPLACATEADPAQRPAAGGHQAAAQEPLEIDHQVKLLLAKPPAEFGVGPECLQKSRLGGAAVEGNDETEIRVPTQQALIRMIDDPGDGGLGIAAPERRQHRQAMDNVTQGAGLDDGNAAGGVILQGDVAACIHAANPFVAVVKRILPMDCPFGKHTSGEQIRCSAA